MLSYAKSFSDEVEAFLAKAKIEPTKLGKEALGDPSFVFDLRKGRSPSGRTMDKVRIWMASWRPTPQHMDAAS